MTPEEFLREHDTSGDEACWCKPCIREVPGGLGLIFVHHKPGEDCTLCGWPTKPDGAALIEEALS